MGIIVNAIKRGFECIKSYYLSIYRLVETIDNSIVNLEF